MSLRVAVLGATGRMGREVARLAEAREAEADVAIVGGVASSGLAPDEARDAGYPRVVALDEAAAVLGDADVVLDVSSPAALDAFLANYGGALSGKALVTGTTGTGDEVGRTLAALAGNVAVVRAANFAVGVAVLRALLRELAGRLSAHTWDVEIMEAHHRGKRDAPSGTAIALAEALAEGGGERLDAVRVDGRSGSDSARAIGEIGIHALRGGSVIGEHTVLFLGPHERLEITHRAEDRGLFALGALHACAWAAEAGPGLYTMDDVLGLAGH